MIQEKIQNGKMLHGLGHLHLLKETSKNPILEVIAL